MEAVSYYSRQFRLHCISANMLYSVRTWLWWMNIHVHEYSLVLMYLLNMYTYMLYARGKVTHGFHWSPHAAAVGNSKWFILCVVMLLWLLAILHFLRTWRKKMTLRPTYDISSTSDPRSPYDVPCHSHSYNYLHRPTQRSNSYTPELSRQSSGSTLHCPSKSYKSRSFNDLHTIIPEDMPAGRSDIPSSSGHSYCRT